MFHFIIDKGVYISPLTKATRLLCDLGENNDCLGLVSEGVTQ